MGNGASVTTMRVHFLAGPEIQAIHDASLLILRDTGVLVHHAGVLNLLAEAGATVDWSRRTARISEPIEDIVNHELRHNQERIRRQANKSLAKAMKSREFHNPLLRFL